MIAGEWTYMIEPDLSCRLRVRSAFRLYVFTGSYASDGYRRV